MGLNIRNYQFDVYCKFQPNTYVCSRAMSPVHRYFWDAKMKNCRSFTYGHCRYTLNNFKSSQECLNTCKEFSNDQIPPNLDDHVSCRLQPEFGICKQLIPMWYFEVSSRQCKPFLYSGCGGNRNRFSGPEECSRTCGGSVGIKPEHELV